MLVSNPLTVHLLAENLYGKRVTLHDLSATTLSEEHFKQIWHCIKTDNFDGNGQQKKKLKDIIALTVNS